MSRDTGVNGLAATRVKQWLKDGCPSYGVPEGDIKRLLRIAEAASVYFYNYAQDEADSDQWPVCGEEQHKDALSLKEALEG